MCVTTDTMFHLVLSIFVMTWNLIQCSPIVSVSEVDRITISPATTILRACSTSEPLSSIRIEPQEMPCNYLYPRSTIQNNFIPKFQASYIESFTALIVNMGKRCFKLELSTSCTQKWFSSNEITRAYTTLDVTRADCYGPNTCSNCEISSQYLPEDCRSMTFGANVVKKVVVFTTSVNVYQNQIGQSFYGPLSTLDNEFIVGGDYKEKVFFEPKETAKPTDGEFTINPSTKELLSYSMRRIMKSSNRTLDFKGVTYSVYDDDHLIRRADIESALAKLASSTASKKRLLQVSADPSLTNYQTFFLNAQVNVTSWYLNYIDCRVKKLSYSLYEVLSRIDGLSSTKGLNSLSSILDLGPGEAMLGGNIIKNSCYKVVEGHIVNQGNCLTYKHESTVMSISNTGELVRGDYCNVKLRLNSTHVIRPGSDDKVAISPEGFTSLLEEEEILNYPPKVVTGFSALNEILKSSTLLNRIEDSGGPQKVSSSTEAQRPFQERVLQSPLAQWLQVVLLLGISVVLVYSLFMGCVFMTKRLRELSKSSKETDEKTEAITEMGGASTSPEPRRSVLSFMVK